MEFLSNFTKNYPIIAATSIVLGLITLIEKSKELVNRKYKLFRAGCETKKDQSLIYLKETEYLECEFTYIFIATFPYTILMLILSYHYELIPMQIFKTNLEHSTNIKTFVFDLAKIVLFTACLYLGYLYQLIIKIEKLSEYDGFILFFKSVLYGPFMEEIIYRFIVFEIIRAGDYKNFYAIIISSLIFGFSHLRRYFDQIYNISVKGIVFQICYTTIFGLLAEYVYVRTNSITQAFILHCFCNYLQLPKFYYLNVEDNQLQSRITTFYLVGLVISIIILFLL